MSNAATQSAARAEKLARTARLATLQEGLAAEAVMLNAAIRAGVVVCLDQASSGAGKQVTSVRYGLDGLWIEAGSFGPITFGNDDRWARLLRIAGIARDPRAL